MRVDIEEVLILEKRREELNAIPFMDIEWFEGGVRVVIPEAAANNWRYIGLNNINFITCGAYDAAKIKRAF